MLGLAARRLWATNWSCPGSFNDARPAPRLPLLPSARRLNVFPCAADASIFYGVAGFFGRKSSLAEPSAPQCVDSPRNPEKWPTRRWNRGSLPLSRERGARHRRCDVVVLVGLEDLDSATCSPIAIAGRRNFRSHPGSAGSKAVVLVGYDTTSPPRTRRPEGSRKVGPLHHLDVSSCRALSAPLMRDAGPRMERVGTLGVLRQRRFSED